MQAVEFPLKLGDKGPKIRVLQDGLQQLAAKGALPSSSGDEAHLRALADEQAQNVFGPATQSAVSALQTWRGAAASGEVDNTTALQLNRALARAASNASNQPDRPRTSQLVDALISLPERDRPDDRQRAQLEELISTHGLGDELWTAVGNTDLRSKLPGLQRTEALLRVAGAHAPMLEALNALAPNANAASADYLAKLSTQDWRELAFTHGAPDGSSPLDYATGMQDRVRRDFPAATLRAQLDADKTKLRNYPAANVSDFLERNPDFNFNASDFDAELRRKSAGSNVSAALKQVRRMQFARWDIAAAAIDAGFDSADRAAAAGPDLLHARLGLRFSRDEIERFHERAVDRRNTGLAVGFVQHDPAPPGACRGVEIPDSAGPKSPSGPNLRTLFGSVDFCECTHCHSVLGPAAYYADLLHFTETSSVYSAFCRRRPDLLHLDLSCDNTNIEILYIDLVLETLENAVALPMDIPIARSGLVSTLSSDSLPENLRDVLARTAITIGETLTVTATPDNSLVLYTIHSTRWVVSDGSRRWEITYEPRQLLAWRIIPGGKCGSEVPWAISLPEYENLDEIETSLKTGALGKTLSDYFAPEPGFPISTGTEVKATTVAQDRNGWDVVIVRKITVKVDGKSLTTYGDSGKPITEIKNSAQVNYVAEWLLERSKHEKTTPKADTLAFDLLRLQPDLVYTITFDKDLYTITSEMHLQFAILEPSIRVTALAYQNSSIQTDLAAMPENRNPEAYEILRSAVFPWTLPFDLPLEETRQFIAELGVSRRMLIELKAGAQAMSDMRAAEILGFSTAEWECILQANVQAWRFWGLKEKGNTIWDTFAGASHQGDWSDVLKSVSLVMQQSRLSYRELLDVLQTIRPVESRTFPAPPLECEPAKLLLTGGKLEDALLWIHRFTRLWRRTGWSMRELDRALAVFDNKIDQPALQGLALMQVLNERLRLPILSLAGVMGNLEADTWTDNKAEGAPTLPSLYARLFQQNAQRASPSFNVFALSTLYNMQAPAAGESVVTLSQHAAFIASALSISQLDAIALTAPANNIVSADALDFPNVAAMFAAATFARALGLSISDYLRWQELLGVTAFKLAKAQRAQALIDFAANVDFARQSEQTLDSLRFVLLGKAEGEFAKTQAAVVDCLTVVRAALAASDVLARPSLANLRTQVLRAGAPAAFVAALESSSAQDAFLWAEIELAPAPAMEPVFTGDAAAHFYYVAPDGAAKARLGCRGAVADALFDPALHPALTAAVLTALRDRYANIRTILFSQAAATPAPTFATSLTPAPQLPADVASFLRYDTAQQTLTLIGLAPNAQILNALTNNIATTAMTDLASKSASFAQIAAPWLPQDVAARLFAAPEDDANIARALRLTAPLLDGDLLAGGLTSFLGLDQNFCADLLDRVVAKAAQEAPHGLARTARSVLFDEAFLAEDPTSPVDTTADRLQLNALMRLKKAALLLLSANAVRADLPWLTGTTFEILDITALPLDAVQSAAFEAWRAWRELSVLASSLLNGADDMVAFAALLSGQKEPAFAQLAAATQTDAENVADAVDMVQMAWPADFRKPARLLQLAGLLNLVRQLGCKASLLKNFAADAAGLEPTQDVADFWKGCAIDARKLFMSMFDADALPARMERVSDRLRTRQRDVLVDYLCARDRLNSADDLFDYYLIDVQMGACMRTSRLKQAINSVQLFVQRCLLNLEAEQGAPPAAINAQRWAWMKHYRIWEANRNVFLFPQNWLYWELRDNKSDQARAFESDLLKGDLDRDSAVTAFRSYLEQVADLSRLVIVHVWNYRAADDDGVTRWRMHVVARDRATPHHYFYRRADLDPETSRIFSWTPWEKVDGEFPSGHVMVCELDGSACVLSPSIEFDNRTYLWIIYMEARKRTPKGWVTLKKTRDSFAHPIVSRKTMAQAFQFRVYPGNPGNAIHPDIYIDCFAADTPETTSKREDHIENGDPWHEGSPQQAAMDIRILDFFKDPENQNTETYLVNKGLTVTLTGAFDEVKWYKVNLVGGWDEIDPEADWNQPPGERQFPHNPKGDGPGKAFTGGVSGPLNLKDLVNPVWEQIRQETAGRRPAEDLAAAFGIPAAQAVDLAQVIVNIDTNDMQKLGEALFHFLNALGTSVTAPTEIQQLIQAINQDLINAGWTGPFTFGISTAGYLGDAAAKAIELGKAIANAIASLKYPLVYKPGRINTLKFHIDLTAWPYSGIYKDPAVDYQIGLADYGEKGSIAVDLVCVCKDGKSPISVLPDRDLTFRLMGEFAFDDSRGLLFQPPPGAFVLPNPVVKDCEHFDSGYHSKKDTHAVKFAGQSGADILSPKNEFFVAIAAGAPSLPQAIAPDIIAAYSDSQFVLHFLPAANGDAGKYRVLPDGEAWIWAGLRAVANRHWQATDIETLALPAPPPVPIVEPATGWLDKTNSVLVDDLAFTPDLPASLYEWETRVYNPLLTAASACQIQNFDLAREFFHAVFNPTTSAQGGEAVRYWRFPPFQSAATAEEEIGDILEKYAAGALSPEYRRELEANIEAWKDDPFNPHLIARFRKRSMMWAVVMQYIDKYLIAAGDQCFRYDTIESINEATQYYILALRLLGPRPQSGPRRNSKAMTYAELRPLLDKMSNAWVSLEDVLPFSDSELAVYATYAGASMKSSLPTHGGDMLASLRHLYFCIPPNDALLALWDKVEGRLSNIRQCKNIDGVERTLPLFEPRIDPELLVRARAAGVDIADIYADLNAPLPNQRFQFWVGKTAELCSELRGFGASILSALEKGDGEELALLKSTHEIALLKLTEQMRKRQVDDANIAIDSLRESRRTAELEYLYFQRLLDNADAQFPDRDGGASMAPVLTAIAKEGLEGGMQGLGMSQTELDQIHRLNEAQAFTLAAGISNAAAGVMFTISAAYPTNAFLQGAGHALNATASVLNAAGGFASGLANKDAIIGGYERRRDQWIFESNMRLRKSVEIDKQWTSLEIRRDIAAQELENTRQQIKNSQAVDDFMRSKYSNADLYRYHSDHLLSLYYQFYQLTFEAFKRAERCHHREHCLPDGMLFHQFRYFDTAKKGLLCGEQMQLDLRRMEFDYHERDKREYELVKHISLLQLDPLALMALRQRGRCEFTTPEYLFDQDGVHYMRRIKSVGLSLPCVTGAYTGVHCTLTLLSNHIRKDATLPGGQYERSEDDARFIDDYTIQSMVTSSGQNDTGSFEVNFRDEKYLIGEYLGPAGATWRLELPQRFRQFDYDTISDVILHIRYTARDGGMLFQQKGADALEAALRAQGGFRMFSARHEFPTAWAKFKADPARKLTLELSPEHYPYWSRGLGPRPPPGDTFVKQVTKATVLVTVSNPDITAVSVDTGTTLQLRRDALTQDLFSASFADPVPFPPDVPLTMTLSTTALNDLWLVLLWSPT